MPPRIMKEGVEWRIMDEGVERSLPETSSAAEDCNEAVPELMARPRPVRGASYATVFKKCFLDRSMASCRGSFPGVEHRAAEEVIAKLGAGCAVDRVNGCRMCDPVLELGGRVR